MLKHSAARVNETRTTTTSGGRTTKILSAITAVITALGTNLPLAGTRERRPRQAARRALTNAPTPRAGTHWVPALSTRAA